MKPETIARRAEQRKEATRKRRTELARRLTEKAEQDPDGIWGELLADLEAGGDEPDPWDRKKGGRWTL